MIKRDLYYERIPTKTLREDVKFLGTVLGNVIKEQEGESFYNLVEKIRKLSKANRKQKRSYKKISKEISLFHDPEEYGSGDDRSERIESYVKDFIPLKLGVLNLKKGKGTLTLKGLKKNGKELIDFRLIMLKRI